MLDVHMSCFAELQGQFLLTSLNASRISGQGICDRTKVQFLQNSSPLEDHSFWPETMLFHDTTSPTAVCSLSTASIFQTEAEGRG